MKLSYFLSDPSSMALSSGLRFSSMLLRYRPSLPLAPTRFPSSLSHRRSELRFLSGSPSSSSPPSRNVRSAVIKSRRSDDADGDEGQDGNGSVLVKGRVGNAGGDGGRVVPTELHKEATEAYMAYAMSVLLGRALPDVRDGLKPVHRRILFAMHELGLSSRKPFKKCARVVGEVLGKFHPHGDTAVYDSLVRMAQDFSLRCPLINGHGNFGSIDADPPAAMRYTECRLEALAEAMLLADLEQDTVDFVPNFDNSQKEPSLLPARLPTLLLNGSSGIAVGMATNIPPHNLGELVDVLCALIHNPEATLQELLEYMPGPDFPTGGVIMGNIGILEAYRTGRGRVTVRGKTEVEVLDSKTKRAAIIIKEIPYQTNKSALVEKIAELVESKSLDGISDIRDESDRSGMRIVIELKRGSDPLIVLNNLYRLTSLQSGFSCNMVGILDRQPKLMGLRELLQAFLDFRCSVIERRARFKLSQAQERRHIVEGIVVGLDNIDGVIRIVREALSNAAASAGLRNEYNLSEKQAEAILDINLRRLTLLERKKFVDESKSLMEQISKLEELLSSKKHILQVIEQEAIELKNKFSSPRRSMLEDSDSGQLEDIDVIPNEEMLLVLSEKGYVKRMKPNTFNLQNRGTIGKSIGKLRVNDAMSDFIVCRAHDHILYFSDKGIVYSARAYKIPECTRTAAGTPLVQILSLTDGERITSVIPVSDFAGDQFLLMLTMNGYVKKVSLSSFSSIRSTGIIAIQLVPGDELKWVRCCTNDDLVAMASQNGMVTLTSCETIRAQGRNTRGAVAMRLKGEDKIASMDIIPAAKRKELEMVTEANPSSTKRLSGPWLLFLSESGFGKRVPLSSFRASPLNRVGLIGYKFSAEDRLAAVFVVGFSLADGESDEQVVLVSQSGTVNRIKVRDVSIQSRYARGVILMRLDHTGKIQSASLISATDTDPEEEIASEAAAVHGQVSSLGASA
ncbi:DNA gyrase subunit A, chloroplastic/mitochondrial isoform X2 [Juglans microcarpa x Juglans regia]|uniref:DNA gyrase subunit A, chloroplastic/mitochondrial isoform X2 n=1 Tax=Juglans microcarpa x Juglans regia TaxID=2249226 RepID=UPI001B7E872A|nr:DNA gyrase subunit A, chloroplastic/mitochondrial isoform X2 [Juglans microcarpa x Juglans regia]